MNVGIGTSMQDFDSVLICTASGKDIGVAGNSQRG